MKFSAIFLLLFCARSAWAFGPRLNHTMLDDPTHLVKIAGNVSDDQKKLLSDDFVLLQNMTFEQQDQELNAFLQTSSTDSNVLRTWFADRVQYIVGEDTDDTKNIGNLKDHYPYPNPDISPTGDDNPLPVTSGPIPSPVPTATPEPVATPTPARTVMVMQNLGAEEYAAAKQSGSLMGIIVDGAGMVPLTSPRVGIIEIGDGLFRDVVSNNIFFPNLEEKANRLYRLSVFFHEARHSDGNGKSLGFFHVLCPPHHPFVGTYSCDRMTNGPYTMGALALRTFTANCKDCTTGEKEVLNLSTLDFFSRLITVRAKNDDDASILSEVKNMEQGICPYIDKTNISSNMVDQISLSCQEIKNALPLSANDGVPAGPEDDSPEGSR